jgi:hypothetical protein
MPTTEYRRHGGRHLTYRIHYDRSEYFIERDGVLKKSVPDGFLSGVGDAEASPDLMLRMAIADIEALIGMDE